MTQSTPNPRPVGGNGLVDDALGSLRAEGLEPSPEVVAWAREVEAGRLSMDGFVASVLSANSVSSDFSDLRLSINDVDESAGQLPRQSRSTNVDLVECGMDANRNSQWVEFTISGTAERVAREGGWPQDNPRGFAALQAAPNRKIGRGHQSQVRMLVEDAEDLAWYLQGVADLWAAMSADERADDRPQPLWQAVERINAAVHSGRAGEA